MRLRPRLTRAAISITPSHRVKPPTQPKANEEDDMGQREATQCTLLTYSDTRAQEAKAVIQQMHHTTRRIQESEDRMSKMIAEVIKQSAKLPISDEMLQTCETIKEIDRKASEYQENKIAMTLNQIVQIHEETNIQEEQTMAEDNTILETVEDSYGNSKQPSSQQPTSYRRSEESWSIGRLGKRNYIENN